MDETISKQLEFLCSSKFDKSIRKFIIQKELKVENVPIFQQVLFKHCKTLQDLGFTAPRISEDWKLQFPIFQKLKVLKIDFYNYEHAMEKNFHVIFDDGTGNEIELDYNRHFPNLKSLTLLPQRPYLERNRITQHWRESYNFYKVFFPFLPSSYEQLNVEHKEEKSFKNLMYLDILFEESCPQRMEMIARNFPNVHNQWLNKIRQKMTDKNKNYRIGRAIYKLPGIHFKIEIT